MRINNAVENVHVGFAMSFITATLAGWTIQEWAAALTALWFTLKCVDQVAKWWRFGIGAKTSDE